MHQLKITNCNNHIEEITLAEGSHTIGRVLDSTLRLEGEEVSRLHASLTINNSHCELRDENSANGTFINGHRITSQNLYDGDAIQIGKFNLRFMSDTATPHFSWKEKLSHIHSEKGGKAPSLSQQDIHNMHKDYSEWHSAFEKKIKKTKIVVFALALSIILSISLTFYYKTTAAKTASRLAERTAQYLAEKNKEALYLGEYDSIDIANLPKGIMQIAIWDRNGALRASHPQSANLLNPPGKISSMHIQAIGNNIEIYAPIYNEAVLVGTLYVVYKT